MFSADVAWTSTADPASKRKPTSPAPTARKPDRAVTQSGRSDGSSPRKGSSRLFKWGRSKHEASATTASGALGTTDYQAVESSIAELPEQRSIVELPEPGPTIAELPEHGSARTPRRAAPPAAFYAPAYPKQPGIAHVLPQGQYQGISWTGSLGPSPMPTESEKPPSPEKPRTLPVELPAETPSHLSRKLPAGYAFEPLHALIRRMDKSSAETKLKRLREEWLEPLDAVSCRVIELEKSLWALTELRKQRRAASDMTPTSRGPVVVEAVPRRSVPTLNIASTAAELHHLAAMQPESPLTHAGPPPEPSPYALPASVTVLGPPPPTRPYALALPDAAFDRVNAPALATALTPPDIKAVLRECRRLLRRGGLLQIEWVDPMPVAAGERATAWAEANLLLRLESAFRCTRPAALLPLWVSEAGLELLQVPGDAAEGGSSPAWRVERILRVAVDEATASVEEKLEAEVGRRLVRRHFEGPGLDHGGTWLWEEEAARRECVEYGTAFRFVTMFAVRP